MKNVAVRAAVLFLAAPLTIVLALGHSPAHAQDTPPAFDPATVAADPLKASADLVSIANATTIAAPARVVIPTFRIAFAVKAKGSASTHAFGASGQAYVHGTYTLRADETMLQAITDAVYKRFVESLTTRGVEVVAPAQATEARFTQRAQAKQLKSPHRFSSGATRREYLLFSPTGIPLYAGFSEPMLQDAYSMGQRLSGLGFDALEYGELALAGALQATVLRPVFWVEFIDVETKGGMFRSTASVSGTPGVKILKSGTTLTVYTHQGLKEVKRPAGDDMIVTYENADLMRPPLLGIARDLQPADSGIAGVADTTDGLVAGVQTAVKVLSLFSGGSTRTDKSYDVTIDSAKYQASAEAALGAVAEAWAVRVAGK